MCSKFHLSVWKIFILEINCTLNRRFLLKALSGLSLIAALILHPLPPSGRAQGLAQLTEADNPVYVVQEGDSLWTIALRFKISIDDLASANGIGNQSQISIGDRLIIPGLSGISGVLTTQPVSFGETLRSLSRSHHIPVDTLGRLNHLTSPAELYAGTNLVLLEENSQATASKRSMLAPGQSLFELGVSQGASAWDYIRANDLDGFGSALPGDVLHLPQGESSEAASPVPGALPEAIRWITLKPELFVQGKAATIEIAAENGLELGGSLNEHALHFFPDAGAEGYIGLQGIHAMTEPGLYPLVITGTLPLEAPYFGASFAFSQAVLVNAGDYVFDPVLVVSPETIDPAVTKPEDAQWAALTAPVTPEKLWAGPFQSPAPPPYSDCWPSQFGSRRSYNGSAYVYFHTGLDFCGGVGTEILAPAAGRVVFAGPLTVRGNSTVIDHGWGIYTAYLHQSEILVEPGDLVTAGQVIGKVGGTGRVTGPHLHWEVWSGGVQVDPMDWLEQSYPR
jgi:murein DD-endopeptidase MepM/ murein hydrolase activator NlpD